VKVGARIALLSAVKEGILDHDYNCCDIMDDSPNHLLIANQSRPPTLDDLEIEDVRYFFSHDVWRSTILELMLDKRKRQLHKIVALTLESTDTDAKDYNSRLRLFNHWKSSGDVVNASAVALDAGKMFEDFGLHHQCIELYHETLEMWENASSPDSNEHWFTGDALVRLSAEDITACVKLYIALGKALTNLHRPAEAVQVYQHALSVS
jgi:predicted ATPase